MFSVDDYYNRAHSGEKVDNTELIGYIKSFDEVVLWGASYLGDAVGKYLLGEGVKIKKYWDLRAEELGEINGIKCSLPFIDEPSDKFLVIFCIGNNIIRGLLLNQLHSKGYNNVLRGDFLFEGAICPFDKTTGVNSRQCQGTMSCRAVFCERLNNIVKNRNAGEDALHFKVLTLVINQRCSLGCKYCTSYMNEYPLKERIDIPFERVSEDIDYFFDAVDSVGAVTVMGGEPFMHPDISKIVKKLSQKDNLGIISIATSGTYPIMKDQLDGLMNSKVNVSFSNYEQALKENQIRMMYKNIELIKKEGISYTVGVTLPEWAIPSTLYDLNDSVEVMEKKKAMCPLPPRCHHLKNGKLHPCDLAQALYSLNISRCEMDYVDVQNTPNRLGLRKRIREFLNQSYYRTCGYCNGFHGLTAKAAEQGYMDFKKPIENRTK